MKVVPATAFARRGMTRTRLGPTGPRHLLVVEIRADGHRGLPAAIPRQAARLFAIVGNASPANERRRGVLVGHRW
jgi:hypothetical protein